DAEDLSSRSWGPTGAPCHADIEFIALVRTLTVTTPRLGLERRPTVMTPDLGLERRLSASGDHGSRGARAATTSAMAIAATAASHPLFAGPSPARASASS